MITIPPCKPNITYNVRKFFSIPECFSLIAEQLKQEKIHTDRVIIYCRTLQECCDVRDFFYKYLESDRLYPTDVPVDRSPFRMVDMYTSITDPVMKKNTVDSFTSTISVLRVVIATTAFGMGVDCSSVRVVINLCPPSDIEEYIQQTGRAGRDGLPSQAILYWSSESVRYASEKMARTQQHVVVNFFSPNLIIIQMFVMLTVVIYVKFESFNNVNFVGCCIINYHT